MFLEEGCDEGTFVARGIIPTFSQYELNIRPASSARIDVVVRSTNSSVTQPRSFFQEDTDNDEIGCNIRIHSQGLPPVFTPDFFTVQRVLVGLIMDDKAVLRHGQRVVTPIGDGEILSGGFSPTIRTGPFSRTRCRPSVATVSPSLISPETRIASGLR